MDEFRENDRLHNAFEATLSGLNGDPWLAQRVLTKAKGEEKVKKKLSAGFVLAMVLVLVAAVALAVATITETGRLMAQTEKENGDYLDWPVEKRAQVVRELMDEGYIPETAERKQLRDGTLSQEDAARIADAAIAEFTGEDARYASFLSIMNAAWGPFGDWTHEQQAWYSQLMEDVGYETSGKTYYVRPTGPLTEQEAIDIAKQETMRVFGIEEGLLDQYRVQTSFQIPENAAPGDKKAYWDVMFDTWNTGLNADELPFDVISMFVDPDTGKLRDPLEELAAQIRAAKERYNAPINQTIRAFLASCGEERSFMTWSLENKARWSAEIAPQINAYLAGNPNGVRFSIPDLASIAFVYALPDEKAITQTDALAIARTALRDAYALSEEKLALLFDDHGNPYYASVFYDVTDPDRPLWKFFLEVPSIYGPDAALAARVKAEYNAKDGKKVDYDQFYKVEINAYTGDVVRTLNMRFMPDTLEGFKDCF